MAQIFLCPVPFMPVKMFTCPLEKNDPDVKPKLISEPNLWSAVSSPWNPWEFSWALVSEHEEVESFLQMIVCAVWFGIFM